METSFGLAHVWNEGDWVTRSVALLLLGMSLASWMVIIIKALDLRRHRAQAQQVESFWHSADFADGLNKLGDDEGNPFRQLALQGREATRHLMHQDGQNKPQLHDSLDVSDWVTRALRNTIDDFTARLQGGLAVLASVGSTAPFVGLFGTVWGIMNSFSHIAQSKNTSLAVVAPGISEALFATAIGLVAAIPAAAAYNILSGQVSRYAQQLEAFAGEFITILSRQLEEQV